MGKVLVLAKYLVKNYFLNPLILPIRRNKVVALLVVAGIASLVLFIAILPSPEAEVEEGPPLRHVLHEIGLNRERAEWILGVASSLLLYYLLLRPSSSLIAMEEAEVEVLLAQPIEMREYFAAKLVADLVNMITWIFLIFVSVFPLVVELAQSSLRGILAIASIGAMFLYMEGIIRTVWNLKARGKDWARVIQAIFYFLIAAGVLHSLMTSRVSPILTLPSWIVVRSFLCSVSLSCDLPSLFLYTLSLLLITVAFLLLAYSTSDALSPEMVSTVRAELKAVKGIEFTSRERVPLEHLVIPDLRSRGNLVALVSIPVIALIGDYLSRVLGMSGDPGFLGSVGAMIIFILAPSIMTSIGDDVVGLWIYRVYSIEMRPFGRALILKYFYRMVVPLAALSAFIFGVTKSPVPLLLLCVFSSATIIAVFLMALPVVYFLPRRRVVRWNPLGYYSLDWLVTILAIAPISMVVMGYFLLAIYFTIVSWEILLLASASSLLMSTFLIRSLGEQLGDLLYSVDLAG